MTPKGAFKPNVPKRQFDLISARDIMSHSDARYVADVSTVERAGAMSPTSYVPGSLATPILEQGRAPPVHLA